jgi:hypothetical protein
LRSPRLRLSALVVVVVLAAAGCGGGGKTVTTTRTVTRAAPGLPAAAEQTRARLLAAAESGDYEALRPVIPATGFAFSYGASAGGPIAYWKNVEQTSEQTPIAILAAIMRMPYTLNRGLYVWPFAYDKRKSDLTAYERRLLGPALLRSYVGEDYYGWRAGIRPDGGWVFFISGD